MITDLSGVRDLLDAQGYLLRRQALERGLDDRVLGRACRGGQLVRIRQGAYCRAEEWAGLDAEERLRRRSRATYDLVVGAVALSHTSAAVEHGAHLWDVDLAEVHLTRLDGASGRREAGVRHHHGSIDDDDTLLLAGRRVTSPLRTALDLAALTGVMQGLVVMDWFLQRGLFTIPAMQEAYAARRMWPGTRALEVIVQVARIGSESPGETRLRFLCWQMGLPEPELQYQVRDERGVLIATVDLAWPDLGIYVEFDGMIKYERLLKPGQRASDVVCLEKVREDAIRRVTGGIVVRFVWSELHLGSAPARQLRRLISAAA